MVKRACVHVACVCAGKFPGGMSTSGAGDIGTGSNSPTPLSSGRASNSWEPVQSIGVTQVPTSHLRPHPPHRSLRLSASLAKAGLLPCLLAAAGRCSRDGAAAEEARRGLASGGGAQAAEARWELASRLWAEQGSRAAWLCFGR